MVGSVGEVLGDLEVGDEREEILGGPAEVEGRGVEFWWASLKVSVDEVGVFSFVVEDSEAVIREELCELVCLVVVFVQVVVAQPDGVMEIEVSEEEGVGKEGLDGFHGVDS